MPFISRRELARVKNTPSVEARIRQAYDDGQALGMKRTKDASDELLAEARRERRDLERRLAKRERDFALMTDRERGIQLALQVLSIGGEEARDRHITVLAEEIRTYLADDAKEDATAAIPAEAKKPTGVIIPRDGVL